MSTIISVLGSTGSIGTQTLDVLDSYRNLLYPYGFSAGNNLNLLKLQIDKFSPEVVSLKDESSAKLLKSKLKRNHTEILFGDKGNIEIATNAKVDRVVIATPGYPGILPTLKAIQAKKIIALATKEVLVAAGSVITQEAKKNKVQILPVDSEHSAIFQCLQNRSPDEVNRIILTCSGGPFRGIKSKDLKEVKLEQALKHPSWKMGKKITIDSATLMNKGFEVIEAFWLFGIPYHKIKVVVHPQSVIHSAVEFVDGTIIAQIGPADMRLPIQHALFYPEKRKENNFKRFLFDDYPNLSFEHPDKETFSCLKLAYEAGKEGGTSPAVLNAANDIAVNAFLEERLDFYKIPQVVEKTLSAHSTVSNPNLDSIFSADSWARNFASSLIK